MALHTIAIRRERRPAHPMTCRALRPSRFRRTMQSLSILQRRARLRKNLRMARATISIDPLVVQLVREHRTSALILEHDGVRWRTNRYRRLLNVRLLSWRLRHRSRHRRSDLRGRRGQYQPYRGHQASDKYEADNIAHLSKFSFSSDVNTRLGEMRSEFSTRLSDLRSHMDSRFDEMRTTWQAELHRVEEVLDARLKHLEER